MHHCISWRNNAIKANKKKGVCLNIYFINDKEKFSNEWIIFEFRCNCNVMDYI